MKARYKLGDVYRCNGYGITITNVLLSAGYHYDDVRYDVEVYHTLENLRKKFRNISEGAISEVIDMWHLRLIGDSNLEPSKYIKKLELQ